MCDDGKVRLSITRFFDAQELTRRASRPCSPSAAATAWRLPQARLLRHRFEVVKKLREHMYSTSNHLCWVICGLDCNVRVKAISIVCITRALQLPNKLGGQVRQCSNQRNMQVLPSSCQAMLGGQVRQNQSIMALQLHTSSSFWNALVHLAEDQVHRRSKLDHRKASLHVHRKCFGRTAMHPPKQPLIL